MSDGLKHDPRLYGETMERMRQGKDFGQDQIRPTYDPVLRRDVVDDAKHGRRIDEYKAVLEATGFRFMTAAQLGPYRGPDTWMPRTEGEWVLRAGPIRANLTSDEVCSWFEDPKALWDWVERWKLEERAKKAGIALPPSRR